MKVDPSMTALAIVSECGRYRYRLSRCWGNGPYLLFVMLNPSTADGLEDDRTIRRCIGFAKAHGFGSMEVVNLFALRATDPRELSLSADPVGPVNDEAIAHAAAAAGAVCLAYGAHRLVDARAQVVLPLLRRAGAHLQCLRITRSGYPEHPLYLPGSRRLSPFNEQAIAHALAGDPQ